MTDLLHHPAFWPALAVLILLAANFIVFLRREWEASHRGVDYAQLYYPSDKPTIRRWRFEGTQLYPEIVWNKQPANWELHIDGQAVATLQGHAPRIDLLSESYTGETGTTLDGLTHNYVLRPLPRGIGPDLPFAIVIIDRAFYLTRQMHFPKDLIRIDTTIPVGEFRRRPLSDWLDDYAYMGTAALTQADHLIRQEIAIADHDTTQVRIEKIVRYMRTELVDAGGVPKNEFRWMDPLAIFEEMRAGTGKGWCTQNAQIFAFFANRASVPTRFIFGATVQDNVILYNGHSWNECWLEDQQRWVYVDPQAIVCGVFDASGRALNSADILHLSRHDTYEGVTARTYKNWQWKDLPVEAPPDEAVTVPFAFVNTTAKKQANEQTIIKYRLPPNVEDVRDIYSMLLTSPTFAWTNFKRYLWQPAPAYSMYPTHGARTYRIRQSLFAALVASVAWLVFALV